MEQKDCLPPAVTAGFEPAFEKMPAYGHRDRDKAAGNRIRRLMRVVAYAIWGTAVSSGAGAFLFASRSERAVVPSRKLIVPGTMTMSWV